MEHLQVAIQSSSKDEPLGRAGQSSSLDHQFKGVATGVLASLPPKHHQDYQALTTAFESQTSTQAQPNETKKQNTQKG